MKHVLPLNDAQRAQLGSLAAQLQQAQALFNVAVAGAILASGLPAADAQFDGQTLTWETPDERTLALVENTTPMMQQAEAEGIR